MVAIKQKSQPCWYNIMKNISLITFILFNYFVIQKYFKNNDIIITNETEYQKTFNELASESSDPMFKTNIMEDKKEIIYLY